MFPSEFKTALKQKAIKLKKRQNISGLSKAADLVHEVLYKFSYQKLDKFLSVSQFALLFSKYYEIMAKNETENLEVATEIYEQIQSSKRSGACKAHKSK